MRKTTHVFYDEMDVKKIVREELESTKPKWLVEKLDKLYELVDKIAGGIKDYREEQELNANKLSDHSDELENHDLRLKKLEHPVL